MVEESCAAEHEWERQVRECHEGEPAEMTAVDIGSLLENSGHERISILKIDVEKAEAVIFSSNFERWIHRVENLAIELHGKECTEVFYRAIDGLPFHVEQRGELTVCRRTAPPVGRVSKRGRDS
jgi:hypothetical protein